MPTVSVIPKVLTPFQFHGLVFTVKTHQAVGDCPFCGKEGKWHASPETGQWDCKSCLANGNPYQFLEQLWKASEDSTQPDEYAALADERGLMEPETLVYWGLCRSLLTGEWILPGYNAEGKLNQLYRYVTDTAGRSRWYATPEMNHSLIGLHLLDSSKPEVHICEGVWDAMSWWEVCRLAGRTPSGWEETLDERATLYATTSVLAVPSAGTFFDSWGILFPGKKITLLYDNDHPHTHEQTGRRIEGAAKVGMERAAGVLTSSVKPPKSVSYLKWGVDGYDLSLKDGLDIRDVMNEAGTEPEARISALGELMERVQPIPEGWVRAMGQGPSSEGECLPCTAWAELRKEWIKAMRWIEGLDRALSVMLACVVSTKMPGDQLWCKIIGPAASGKSTLCEALSVNKRYILAKSTIRGFHSGFKSKGAEEEDNSLVAQLNGKTLVTKDGDTLLQSPNLGQILAEARDLYDCTSRTHYRNKTSRVYEGVRMTWILCGTSSLRAIDSSELGERFIDCVIMEWIDPDLEDDVLARVAYKSERVLSGAEADGKIETQYDSALSLAMQLTGGYVSYLRSNAKKLFEGVRVPEAAIQLCINLGKFVAYMRARPSTRQIESHERELATRLVSQMVRLAKCLAVVLNRKVVDDEVMRRVTRCALDTARGRTLKIADILYVAGKTGMEPRALSFRTEHSEHETGKLLVFLSQIGAVECFRPVLVEGVRSGKPRWRLTERMDILYGEVMKGKEERSERDGATTETMAGYQEEEDGERERARRTE